MPIKFRCEHCRQLLGISKSKAGQVVDCPTCGRSVAVPDLDGKSSPVPPPKLDFQDSSLLSALDALAGLGNDPSLGTERILEPDASTGAGASVNSPAKSAGHSQESPRGAKVIDLPPAPSPVAIDLPPLEQPVAIVEPQPPRRDSPATTPAPPVDRDGSDAPAEPTPWSALEELARRPSAPAPVVPLAPRGSGGTLWPTIVVAGLAFLAGFLVRAQFFPGPAPQAALSEQPAPVTDATTNHSPTTARREPAQGGDPSVRGRITFRTTDGTSQPDSGACVILLPETRTGTAKLPIIGFRPSDKSEDREIARAAVRAVGGDLAVVDESGYFDALLKSSGTYHVVVLSHFQSRPATDTGLAPAVRSVLASYFDRPDQLPGRLRYQLGQLRYRGEGTETWDYSFERM